MGCAAQSGLSPLIEAYTANFSCQRRLRVQLGRQTKHDFAGIGLVRHFSDPLARHDIIVHSLVKRRLEICDSFGVEADEIIDGRNVTEKNLVIAIEFDDPGLAFIDHCFHSLI